MIPRLAFIGFGEAGQHIARGLRREGVTEIAVFDLLVGNPAWQAKAEAAGVAIRPRPAEAVAEADIVISAVTAKETLKAAESAAPHLRGGQVWLDINSASPKVKQAAARAIEAASAARFVEAAAMDTVPGRDHKVPLLLAGPDAAETAARLSEVGMVVEAVGDRVGQASAIKMIRSVLIKGFESLFVEAMVAANRIGVEERILASVQGTFPGLDWRKVVGYHLGRVAQHAGRRAAEMEEVAATLAELGVEPIMASASAKRLAWCAALGLKERFATAAPADYADFLAAVRALEAAEGTEMEARYAASDSAMPSERSSAAR